jgi:hypothetical protein
MLHELGALNKHNLHELGAPNKHDSHDSNTCHTLFGTCG